MFASITTAFNTAKNAVVNTANKVPTGVYVGVGVAAAAVGAAVIQKKFGVLEAVGSGVSGLFKSTANVAAVAAEGVAEASAS